MTIRCFEIDVVVLDSYTLFMSIKILSHYPESECAPRSRFTLLSVYGVEPCQPILAAQKRAFTPTACSGATGEFPTDTPEKIPAHS